MQFTGSKNTDSVSSTSVSSDPKALHKSVIIIIIIIIIITVLGLCHIVSIPMQ